MDQTSAIPEDNPLGELQDLYERTSDDDIRDVGIAAGLVVVGLVGIAIGANLSDSGGTSKFFLISLGIGLLCVAGYLFFRWYAGRDIHVLIYNDGLTVIRNDDMRSYRWDEIDSLFQKLVVSSVYGIRGATSKKYTLVPKKGAVIIFTEILPNVDELGQRIQQQITLRRLPEDLKRMDAGETIRFGPISIDKQGVIVQQKTLPWDAVGRAKAYQGLLQIGDKWIAISEIPNLLLLLAHIEKKIGVPSSNSQP
jgi:hypothetical protein